jgi:hypothetical protein
VSAVADIWNQALSLIGNEGEVQDPESDTDTPAKACRRHWETVRDEVLRDFAWPKFTQTEDLTLVEEDPNDGIEWAFTYAQPANCIRIRRILNGSTRIDNADNVTPYKLGRDADGNVLIFCDLEDAQIEYAYQETNTEKYDADLVSSMAHLLASRIAPKFGPYAVKLGDRALRIYVWRLAQARDNALNEQRPDIDLGSGFSRSR